MRAIIKKLNIRRDTQSSIVLDFLIGVHTVVAGVFLRSHDQPAKRYVFSQEPLFLKICVFLTIAVWFGVSHVAYALTLSGTVYSDEGTTPITSGPTVKISVGTSTVSTHTTTANGSGVWSFNLGATSITPSTPILVWVDGSISTRAALFTKASSSVNNIQNLNLYQNRLVISHEGTSGTSTTVSNMSFYDGDNDSDIQFTANSNELSVANNQKLYIKENKVFAPGGPVTVNGNASSSPTDGSFLIASGATYTAGGTTTIAGSFTASSTATYNTHASGTVMTASTTGKAILAPIANLGNLIFNGTGGTWSIATTSTTTNFTITAGTVIAPSTTLSILGNYLNNGTFTHNSGTVYFASTTEAQSIGGTLTGSSAFYGVQFNGSTTVATRSGLVGHWPLEETYTVWANSVSGTTTDTSGSGNNGILANIGSSTAIRAGKLGQSFRFGGVNSAVTVPNTSSLNGLTVLTACAWVRHESTGNSYPNIFSTFNTAVNSAGWDLYLIYTGGPAGWGIGSSFQGSTGYTYSEVYSAVVPSNTWTFVCIQQNGDALANFKLYVNGREVAQESGGSGGTRLSDTGHGFSIGTQQSVAGYEFTGEIDDGRVYNRALTSSEIEALYYNRPKTFSSNASTSPFTVVGGSVMSPRAISIAGNYSNNGTVVAGLGTTTLDGTSQQILSGSMVGTSTWSNLTISNTSGAGSSSQSVVFLNVASTTDTLTMHASTSARFLASATSTFQHVSLQGMSNQYVTLRSSSPGTQYGFAVPGTQKTVSYVDVRDAASCPLTITADNSRDSGNNRCWSFPISMNLTSEDNQIFVYGQSATAISPITFNEGATPIITAANDFRIKIGTSTVRMLWDTTDTSASIGGTAAGKVSGTVSYEGGGSVLVIPVNSNFSANDTLTISGLSFTNFSALNSAAVALSVYAGGSSDNTAEDTDDRTVGISGSHSLLNHSAGQVSDNFTTEGSSDIPLFGFRMTPSQEDMTISTVSFQLSNVRITTSNLTDLKLYRDLNNSRTLDGGDTAIGGAGILALSGDAGTITFSTSFSATSAQDFLLVGTTVGLIGQSSLRISLPGSAIVTTGATTGLDVTETGTISSVQHIKYGGRGGGGSSSFIGSAPPAGDGIRSGGGGGGGGGVDPDTGTPIGNALGFDPPSSNTGSWTNGGNAYVSDGQYATAVSSVVQTYGSFGFSIPDSNQINGIAVKIESSGSTAAGSLNVRLSWDGGTSFTSSVQSGTLGLTDAVYTLGGGSDTWGHSWTASELVNGNFVVEITANPSGNTVRIDAIQVRVYHQSTGGGGGGGGAVFKKSDRYFASAGSSLEGRIRLFLKRFIPWIL